MLCSLHSKHKHGIAKRCFALKLKRVQQLLYLPQLRCSPWSDMAVYNIILYHIIIGQTHWSKSVQRILIIQSRTRVIRFYLKNGVFKPREAGSKEEYSISLPSAKHNVQFCIFLTRDIHACVVNWLRRPQGIAVWCLKLLDYCNCIHQQTVVSSKYTSICIAHIR